MDSPTAAVPTHSPLLSPPPLIRREEEGNRESRSRSSTVALPSSAQAAARSWIHAIVKALDGDARVLAVAHSMDFSGRHSDSGTLSKVWRGLPLGLVLRCIAEVKASAVWG